MTHRNTGAIETFEMVISDPTYYSTLTGDAEITCLYKSILNNDADENYSSVGFENYNQSSGIQYEYDNIYSPGAAPLVNNRAIIITTNTGRGGVRGHVELSNGGHNENVMVISSTGQHRTTPESGDFWIKDIPPDSVDLFASAGGYFPDTIIGLPVIANSSISGTDFNLIQCPVPANLIASDTLSGRVEVSWDSVSSMLLAGYNLYRSRWEAGGFEKVNGTPLQVNHFNDLTALDSITYRYYITAVYSSGDWSTESFASNIDLGGINSPTRTAGEPSLPTEFFLSQNYPNPFNPTTIISYGLPNDCRVKVEVYNLLGQKIKTLVNGPEKAGIKSVVWDGRDTAGKAISSGVYFCHIDAGSYQASKKMLMLK
ncbi:MAG TPA: hypothetical protein DCZ43_12870 [candidate division Zixibacteria bacterium]|nr:hypothetical protein [candidate division Zixibacteria bacterium]